MSERREYEYDYPFGEWLQDQLDRMAIPDVQKEIADAVGVSQATVSRWLSGNRRPNTRHIRTLAYVLGVPVDVVYTHAGYYGTVYRYRDADAYISALESEMAELDERREQIQRRLSAVRWEIEHGHNPPAPDEPEPEPDTTT